MLAIGQIVRLKAEFLDPNEPQIAYRVVDVAGPRIGISPVVWEFRIRPIETVDATMVERVVAEIDPAAIGPALGRPKTGWVVHCVRHDGLVVAVNEGCSLELARGIARDWALPNRSCLACCIDNLDGVHSDNDYGDIDVLRWAGLR